MCRARSISPEAGTLVSVLGAVTPPFLISSSRKDRAQYDKHADRAAKQFEQQRIDMLNAKKWVIIFINMIWMKTGKSRCVFPDRGSHQSADCRAGGIPVHLMKSCSPCTPFPKKNRSIWYLVYDFFMDRVSRNLWPFWIIELFHQTQKIGCDTLAYARRFLNIHSCKLCLLRSIVDAHFYTSSACLSYRQQWQTRWRRDSTLKTYLLSRT